MKKIIVLFILVSIAFTPVLAQVKGQSSTITGQCYNGTTGLYSIPTGRIGWENTNFGLDFGYRAIIHDRTAHIPTISLSLFKFLEFAFAFDFQPEYWRGPNVVYENDDFLFGFKVKLPTGNTSIAIGGNFDFNNVGDDSQFQYNTFQPYIAITYPGNFFNMPAETTIVIGKTFYEGHNNTDIDFGMGFDLILLPKVFNNLVHILVDFANFSYSSDAWPNWRGEGRDRHQSFIHRGIMSTGFRFDLSQLPPLNKFKFVLDLAFNDILDDNDRTFTLGFCFGVPIN